MSIPPRSWLKNKGDVKMKSQTSTCVAISAKADRDIFGSVDFQRG